MRFHRKESKYLFPPFRPTMDEEPVHAKTQQIELIEGVIASDDHLSTCDIWRGDGACSCLATRIRAVITPVAGSGWNRDDLSWAFPGFDRSELERIVADIQSSNPALPVAGERTYLSGPMKGKTLHNFPLFMEVSSILRGYFHLDVLSPHEITHVGQDLRPEDYLQRDLHEMLAYGCRSIVMMDNWLDSWGACFELNVAAKLGFSIYLWDNASRIPTLYYGEALRYYVR